MATITKSGIYVQASEEVAPYATTIPEGKAAAPRVCGVPAAPRQHPRGPGHLTLVHYAELCAAIEARPRRVEEIARSFGLSTRADLEREDAWWRKAFRQDAGVFELFLEVKLDFARRPRRDFATVIHGNVAVDRRER